MIPLTQIVLYTWKSSLTKTKRSTKPEMENLFFFYIRLFSPCQLISYCAELARRPANCSLAAPNPGRCLSREETPNPRRCVSRIHGEHGIQGTMENGEYQRPDIQVVSGVLNCYVFNIPAVSMVSISIGQYRMCSGFPVQYAPLTVDLK